MYRIHVAEGRDRLCTRYQLAGFRKWQVVSWLLEQVSSSVEELLA